MIICHLSKLLLQPSDPELIIIHPEMSAKFVERIYLGTKTHLVSNGRIRLVARLRGLDRANGRGNVNRQLVDVHHHPVLVKYSARIEKRDARDLQSHAVLVNIRSALNSRSFSREHCLHTGFLQ